MLEAEVAVLRAVVKDKEALSQQQRQHGNKPWFDCCGVLFGLVMFGVVTRVLIHQHANRPRLEYMARVLEERWPEVAIPPEKLSL